MVSIFKFLSHLFPALLSIISSIFYTCIIVLSVCIVDAKCFIHLDKVHLAVVMERVLEVIVCICH